ncbi:MAG: hypothetical protein LBU32_20515 [Clostridiales bacterium]|nr:hypothetical protein [Clostridiales bacterium]
MKEGTKRYESFLGAAEWYCIRHYNEINRIIGKMERDIGAGSTSKHTCEATGCKKEGTKSMAGFFYVTRWYCTQQMSYMKYWFLYLTIRLY